ncbi:histone H3 [Entamoeba marina]
MNKALVMMPKSYKIQLSKQLGIPWNKPIKRNPNKVNQEIRQLQRTSNLLIPSTTFGKCVKSVVNEYSSQPLCIRKDAQLGLHEASEAFLVSLFQEANLIAQHSKRVTVTDRDMHLAMRLKCL